MMNPVMRRETRTTLRNWKLFIVIAVYVALLTLIAGFYTWNEVYYSYRGGFSPYSMMTLYVLMTVFELGLVLLTVPALTAGSISGERERQTLDLMLVTKMSPFAIVSGKLMSCLSAIFLIILASVPAFAVVFYFGGVSFVALLSTTGFFLTVCCMVGAFSIFVSTVIKKTSLSMVVVYLFVGLLCLGTLILCAIIQAAHWSNYNTAAPAWASFVCLWPNPVVGLVSIIEEQIGIAAMDDLINMFYYVDNSVRNLNLYWILNVVGNLGLTAVFLALAAWRIQPVKPGKGRKPKANKKEKPSHGRNRKTA